MKNKQGFTRAKYDIEMTPGEMLKTLREIQELSQKELAELSGMRQSNISAIETGAIEMGRERALALAQVLKVHPAVIMFPQFDPASIGIKL